MFTHVWQLFFSKFYFPIAELQLLSSDTACIFGILNVLCAICVLAYEESGIVRWNCQPFSLTAIAQSLSQSGVVSLDLLKDFSLDPSDYCK